jgi:hypothetical protein
MSTRHKDPADLWVSDPDQARFCASMAAACAEAEPVAEPEPAAPASTSPPSVASISSPRVAGGEIDPLSHLAVMSATDLLLHYPTQRPSLVEGLLRQGETMNLIASPKVGKSLLALAMGIAVSNGTAFLGRITHKTKVLIIDNELHAESAAFRLREAAKFSSVDGLEFVLLRGRLECLEAMRDRIIGAIKANGIGMVILDALYRMIPAGISENDNAGMMVLYNLLDQIAAETGAAIVLVHHSSKGNQSNKSITDGGAGAGSISRAADTHVYIREHETDGHYVLEAVTRSWKQPDPIVITREGMVWEVVTDANPRALKRERPANAGDQLTEKELVDKFLTSTPATVDEVAFRISADGLSVGINRIRETLKNAVYNGLAQDRPGKGRTRLYYRPSEFTA